MQLPEDEPQTVQGILDRATEAQQILDGYGAACREMEAAGQAYEAALALCEEARRQADAAVQRARTWGDACDAILATRDKLQAIAQSN